MPLRPQRQPSARRPVLRCKRRKSALPHPCLHSRPLWCVRGAWRSWTGLHQRVGGVAAVFRRHCLSPSASLRLVVAALVAASLSSPALSSRWHCAWRAPRSASADWHSRVDLHSRAGSCRPSSPRCAAHRPHHVEPHQRCARHSARPLLTRRSLSQDHEWVKMDGDIGTIGIPRAGQLGDVVLSASRSAWRLRRTTRWALSSRSRLPLTSLPSQAHKPQRHPRAGVSARPPTLTDELHHPSLER